MIESLDHHNNHHHATVNANSKNIIIKNSYSSSKQNLIAILTVPSRDNPLRR
jgi:hypothetical protein